RDRLIHFTTAVKETGADEIGAQVVRVERRRDSERFLRAPGGSRRADRTAPLIGRQQREEKAQGEEPAHSYSSSPLPTAPFPATATRQPRWSTSTASSSRTDSISRGHRRGPC